MQETELIRKLEEPVVEPEPLLDRFAEPEPEGEDFMAELVEEDEQFFNYDSEDEAE